MNNDRIVQELSDVRSQLFARMDPNEHELLQVIDDRISALEEEDRHRPPSTDSKYRYDVIRLGEGPYDRIEYNINHVPEAGLVSTYCVSSPGSYVVYGVFKRRV